MVESSNGVDKHISVGEPHVVFTREYLPLTDLFVRNNSTGEPAMMRKYYIFGNPNPIWDLWEQDVGESRGYEQIHLGRVNGTNGLTHTNGTGRIETESVNGASPTPQLPAKST